MKNLISSEEALSIGFATVVGSVISLLFCILAVYPVMEIWNCILVVKLNLNLPLLDYWDTFLLMLLIKLVK